MEKRPRREYTSPDAFPQLWEERMEKTNGEIQDLRERLEKQEDSHEGLKKNVTAFQVQQAQQWGEIMGVIRSAKFLLTLGVSLAGLMVAIAGAILAVVLRR